ncbi:MAG TPA: sigma-70 family RNA polymerase sigma factor [Candidatus Acidoferrales bacterium]|jgi:RNA polymerase sigma factor (sigma-70 family)|nr:sigma-70 family RNA polymerase sigma factor [Candidatus Acidoferrales bacterium]
MPDPDDITLLRRYAEGDESAFTALFERYINLVYSTALRQVRNPSHAEEITQAVFILLARKAKSLSPKTVLSGWLYQAARLTTASLIKREIRRQRREQEVYMQTLTEPETSLWEQISPLLDEAMGRLGEQDRNAIVLRFFENRTPQEVAATMKLNEVTARKRVSRALEKLRTFFAKRGVVSTTAIIAGAVSANSVHAAPAGLANTLSAVALAKGAAASASTLTLAQGALKFMAWSKAKTVVITSAALLFATGTSFVTVETWHVIRVDSYPNIAGTWEGIAHLGSDHVGPGINARDAAQTRVVLKLTKTFGGYRATADWIDLGKKDVPLSEVIYNYPTLQITQNALRRDFWNLKVDPHATELVWSNVINFIQSDPVVLTRTTIPDTVPDPITETDFEPGPGLGMQGYWEGEIGTGTNAVPVDLKIARQTDGTYRAEGGSPTLGIQGQPIIVSYDPPTVKITPADDAGTFSGQLNDSGTEISGSWTQGGQSLPAIIKRADYDAEHAHDADKNYSFISKNDLQGHWKGTWTVTFGSATVPIRYALDIAKLPDGSYSAALASLDEFGAEAPVPPSEFEYSPPDLHMKWKWSGGAYDGRLKNGRIVGTWRENVGGWPLIFEREN